MLCPNCKADIDVPHLPEGGGTEQPNLIKFRCPRCNQKIGLSPEYAGKQVRCAKCRSPLRVPDGPSPSKPPSVSKKTSPPTDDFNPFADLPDFNESLQTKKVGAPVEIPLQRRPVDKQSQGGEFTDMARGIPTMTVGAIGVDKHSRGSSSGLHIDNTLLALLASVIFVVFGGIIWGFIAKYTYCMELGIEAWGIGVLAGLGIYLFTTNRGILLGIAAALIALFGILCGKYFIAKWYYMPKLMAKFQKEGAASFFDPNNIKLSEGNVQQIMTNPGQMFGLVAMQLADDGKLTKEDADYYIIRKFAKTSSQQGQGSNVEPDEAAKQEKELKHKDVEAKVYKCLAEWDEQKKADVVRTQYPKMMREFTDVFAKSRIMNVISFAVAYITAFSFFDLIWFPLAIVTAYKFGTGERD
jgi:uncharacterized protein YneF (UPF0154 family)/DNA-directed RNA polymerase subunit RPC12/RpoP